MERWNPRYLCYAEAHGNDPAAQIAADTKTYPGGKMAGYMVWIGQRWAEWRALRGYDRERSLSDQDHSDFDAWLAGTGGGTRMNGIARAAVQAGGEQR